MGLLQEVLGPLSQRFEGLGTASQVAVAIAGVIALLVTFNIAQQIFFANPNEPPVVFHLLPFFGSTVEYGIDPPRFFKKMRAKVCAPAGRRTEPQRNCPGSNL
jgi:sterol 14alpha-demethylase